ncbi:MAG: riboflavin synthase, partial [Eudoraea sp.]|nr:riboflavin synthase [Eudoraea sp.]
MFTGIIETLGEITQLEHEGGNLNITVETAITPELTV